MFASIAKTAPNGVQSVPKGWLNAAPFSKLALVRILDPALPEPQAITGASASMTVTSKLQLAELPEASVTVKELVVVPTGWFTALGRPEV